MAIETESNLNSRRHLNPTNLMHRSIVCGLGELKMDMPFQDSMNMCHHLTYDLASLLIREMLRCFRFASVRREISLPMNDLPGLTTMQA